MKTKITEQQLRQIVAESIQKVLKESLNKTSQEKGMSGKDMKNKKK